MNILEEIVSYKRTLINKNNDYKTRALKLQKKEFSFEKALLQTKFSFICEIKKASPSKGIISVDFPYLEILKGYEAGGATCISVLTEDKYFLGSNETFVNIRQNTKLPLLRKDFIIDESQIYESRLLDADAILLICAILDDKQLKKFYKIATSLGLSCLVETHNEDEIRRALKIGAKIIGVNNRDLKDFSVAFANSIVLRKLVPHNVVMISESGVSCSADVSLLKSNGINGALIGEYLMKSHDVQQTLRSLHED